MKAIALAALALSALATPALAGPYVESKHEFKGTDEDYKKTVHQGRIGYETKVGVLSSTLKVVWVFLTLMVRMTARPSKFLKLVVK